MDDVTLREAIDACRPGSSDLSLPELAELAHLVASDPIARSRYEASLQFDLAVGEALHDVPLPAGLAQRLLAATTRDRGERAAAGDEAPAIPTVALPARKRPSSWAASLAWATPLATLVLVAAVIGVVVRFSSPPTISTDQLVDRSREWQEQLDHERWNESLKAAPRDEFPLSSSVAVSPWRWQRIETPTADVVVYDGGPPAVLLFVVRSKSKVQGLTASPKLLSATGGWSVGAWQVGDLTYVLVVEGDKRRYESYLKTPAAA